MRRPCRQTAGFSLIEILLVLALMAVMAGLVMPSSNPSIHDQLHAAGRIVVADLAYARSLAVTYNSRYLVEFNAAENCYVLSHSGADATLDDLPDSPWRNPDDPADEHVVDLDDLPELSLGVKIAHLAEEGSSAAAVNDVEFGPLGETTRTGRTLIWLTAGESSGRRYLLLSVNPVTGLATVGPFSAEVPEVLEAAGEAIPQPT
jgi:prepilin-type N-terminal cleavage/methylation domain-containing protein